MRYFSLEAEVAGGFGPNSIVHKVPGNLLVEKLHYVFEGWFGDEILESTPCYIVTEKLAGIMSARGLTGITFDSVETSRSDIYMELHPDREIPPFLWMKVFGVKGQDDFFFARYGHLVVSERAWEVIRPYATHATVHELKD